MIAHAWLVYLAAGSLATGAYFAFPAGVPQDLFYAAIGLSAVVAIVAGVRINRPTAPSAWYWIAAGQLAFVGGDLLWVLFDHVLHIEPFPSLADVSYLAGYPLTAVGLLRLTRARTPGRDRSRLIDATIIATGVGLLAWVFVIDPYVDDHTLTVLELAISIAYPLGDVLMVAIAAWFFSPPAARAPAPWLIGASLLSLLVADVVYGQMALAGTYEAGPVDTGWLLAYVTFGAAALHPTMRALSHRGRRPGGSPGWPRLALLAGAALLAPVALVLQAYRGVELNDVPVLAIGSAMLFLLVVARMRGLVREVEAKVELLDAQGETLTTTLRDLERTEADRKRLLDRTIRAAEEERVRVAGELHDGPIQRLISLGYLLSLVRLQIERSELEQGKTGLQEAEEKLSGTIQELRRLMVALRPPVLDERGVEAALRDLAEGFTRQWGVPCSLEASLNGRLDGELETILYRVTQEALTNVAKHARASRVSVIVEATNGSVELLVRDDGQGFDPALLSRRVKQGHLGMVGMREQVEMVGGRWEVRSRPGEGTLLRAAFQRTKVSR